MGTRTSAEETTQARRRFRPVLLLYLTIPIVVIATTVGLLRLAAQAPVRELAFTFRTGKLVMVRLNTVPHPPLATGTVRLELVLRDSRGRSVEVDQVAFEYGPVGQPAVASGEAQRVGDGLYVGGLRFSYVGKWWIKVRITRSGETAERQFTVTVKPAL